MCVRNTARIAWRRLLLSEQWRRERRYETRGGQWDFPILFAMRSRSLFRFTLQPKKRHFFPKTSRQFRNSRSATQTTPKRNDFSTPRCDLRVLRSEEHTSELQSHVNLVCRLLLEK